MENKTLRYVLLITLALIWGSSFILIKKGLLYLNPFQVGALRIVFAAMFIIVVGFRYLAKINRRHWKYLFITAMLGTFIPAFLFSWAQTSLNSSISAILNSLTPLNTLLIGIWFFGYSFQRRQLWGVVIGFMGSILLIINGINEGGNQDFRFSILLIIATWCYATNVNMLNKYLYDLNPISITVGNFSILLLPALGVLFGSGFSLQNITPEITTSIGYLALLGIVGTAMANIIFFKLIKISSPIFASSVTYLIPLVASVWGLFDHEVFTWMQLLGAVIIMCGVYLSAKK